MVERDGGREEACTRVEDREYLRRWEMQSEFRPSQEQGTALGVLRSQNQTNNWEMGAHL